ncbi:MAG: hypothetical protein V1809_16545 [Planctomycetota bacterium]
MKKEYNITLEQASRLSVEFLKQSGKWRRMRRLLVLVALALACLYTWLKPPIVLHNGLSSPIMTLVISLMIYIPLLALVLYTVFRYIALNVPRKILEKEPEESWGSRTIEIAKGEIILCGGQMSQTFKLPFIDAVVETASGCHLLHGDQVYVGIPKSECSCAEIKQALKDAEPNQAAEVAAHKVAEPHR